ncbi:MAG: C-terminal helicase domain-containing protein [Gemmatimonadaceae bacterium]
MFCRTKRGANRVGEDLAHRGVRTGVIHGNKSQNARNRALDDFKSGRVRVLVATDIAARGLDIKHLPLVVNFDLPLVAEDYVHRVGRTGRAGQEGRAVSLVSAGEAGLLRQIQRVAGAPLERVAAPAIDDASTHRTGEPAPVRHAHEARGTRRAEHGAWRQRPGSRQRRAGGRMVSAGRS